MSKVMAVSSIVVHRRFGREKGAGKLDTKIGGSRRSKAKGVVELVAGYNAGDCGSSCHMKNGKRQEKGMSRYKRVCGGYERKKKRGEKAKSGIKN